MASSSTAEFVRLESHDGVGVIRLDRAPMNALDARVQRELIDAATEAGSVSAPGAVGRAVSVLDG